MDREVNKIFHAKKSEVWKFINSCESEDDISDNNMDENEEN